MAVSSRGAGPGCSAGGARDTRPYGRGRHGLVTMSSPRNRVAQTAPDPACPSDGLCFEHDYETAHTEPLSRWHSRWWHGFDFPVFSLPHPLRGARAASRAVCAAETRSRARTGTVRGPPERLLPRYRIRLG